MPAHHPIAWRHRATGLTSLYLAPHVIAAVTRSPEPPRAGKADDAALPAATSLPGLPGGAVVDVLSELATSARFRYRHRWDVGDAVVWDNTATMHAATETPPQSEAQRTMWRTTMAHDDVEEDPAAAMALAARVFEGMKG